MRMEGQPSRADERRDSVDVPATLLSGGEVILAVVLDVDAPLRIDEVAEPEHTTARVEDRGIHLGFWKPRSDDQETKTSLWRRIGSRPDPSNGLAETAGSGTASRTRGG